MGRRAGQQDYDAAWAAAVALYRALNEGGELLEWEEDPPIPLEEGELCFAIDTMRYSRFYALEGSVTMTEYAPRRFPFRSPWGMLADSMRRSANRREFERQIARMEVEHAAQWRNEQFVQVVVTDERLACAADAAWLSFWYGGITGMSVDLPDWSFTLDFDDTSPLRLQGPAAPTVALAVAYFSDGLESLGDPAFAPLAGGPPGTPA